MLKLPLCPSSQGVQRESCLKKKKSFSLLHYDKSVCGSLSGPAELGGSRWGASANQWAASSPHPSGVVGSNPASKFLWSLLVSHVRELPAVRAVVDRVCL